MHAWRRNSVVHWMAPIGGPPRSSFGPQVQHGSFAQRRSVDETQVRVAGSVLRIGLFIIAAACPVLSISAHVFGVLPMDQAARFLVVPAALVALILAMGHSPEAALFRRAVLAGIVAVTVYDSTRMPFVLTGIWGDFIPNVGGWVTGTGEPSALLGYTWRYLGNGGGIAAVFVLAAATLGIRRHVIPLAVGYGVFVWSGLMGTVTLAPRGEELLFALTPLSFTLSLVGHLVYGSVLGWMYSNFVLRQKAPVPLAAAELPGVAHLRRSRLLRIFRDEEPDIDTPGSDRPRSRDTATAPAQRDDAESRR